MESETSLIFVVILIKVIAHKNGQRGTWRIEDLCYVIGVVEEFQNDHKRIK